MSGPGPGTRDPEVIDWDEIRGVVRPAFFTVRRALARGEAGICRHVMTEGAWEVVRAEVEVLKLDGRRNLQVGLDLTDVQPGQHDVLGEVDQVTVRVLVSGVDCIVDARSGELVSGSREHQDHVEDWTLERDRGAVERVQGAARRCPACGGPLSINDDGRCSFCQAVVPGAKDDWLVSGIARPSMAQLDPAMNARANLEAGKVVVDALAAQAAEAGTPAPTALPPHLAAGAVDGVAQIGRRDPGFNTADLVVEAREVFLRLEASRNNLSPADVRALLADDLYTAECDRAAAIAAAGRHEVRAYLDITDVTFVEAASAQGRDRLVARVRARSARSVLDAGGALIEGSATTHGWAEDLVFERAATATTNPLSGLLAHRCPACGAPAQVSDDGRCVFCAEHVTGGEKDWILAAVRTGAEP